MSSGSSLIDAARRGDADAVRAHLHEATQRDTRGWTALMHASARNFAECVKALIPYERGLADPQKITALMIAADNGHTEVVRLLAKEESRLQNSDGWTALMHASYRGFDECAELLLDEAGMQTTRRKDGMAPGSTALMVAARFSRPECVDLLRDREKGFVDSEGHDALWYAENKGVNPNVKTSEVYRDPRVLKLLEGTKDVHSDGGMGGVESGPAQTNIEADPIDPVPILPPQCQDDRNDSIPARPNEPRKQGRDAPVDDSRLRMLQETLSKKNQEIDQLKAVNTSLRADIDERDEYIRILEDTLRENEKRHNELTDEFSALKEGSTALEDHIGQLQQRLANTEEDRRLARNEASEARARAEQLQRENAERQNVLDATKRELENSRRQLRETGEERSRVATQLSQSEESCRGLVDEVTGLQKQVEEGKNEQKKNAALIDSPKAQLAKTTEDLKKELADQKTRIFILENENTLLKNGSLIPAAIQGDLNTLRRHLDQAGQKDSSGMTALMHAASRGQTEVVRLLRPLEARLQDGRGRTALMHAVGGGHEECVGLLLLEQDIVNGEYEFPEDIATKSYEEADGERKVVYEKIVSLLEKKSQLPGLPKNLSEYHLTAVLGKGTFGVVYAGHGNGRNVAVKVVSLGRHNDEERRLLRREAEIFPSLDHPNILRCLGTGENDIDDTYVIVTDLCCGDLRGEMNRRKKANSSYSDQEVWRVIREVADALTYLHEKRHVHRDLKPANILLSSDGRCVLGGFEVARTLGDSSRMKTTAGTPLYMAPEIHREEDYDKSVDVWALGVVAHELCTGELPFSTVPAILERGPPAIENRDGGLVDLIFRMLSKNPERRPTAREVLEEAEREDDTTPDTRAFPSLPESMKQHYSLKTSFKGRPNTFKAVDSMNKPCTIEIVPRPEGPSLLNSPTELKDLRHQNVLEYSCVTDDGKGRVFIVTAWHPSTLQDAMARRLGNGEIKQYLRQLALGLEYLHGKGIVLRSICPKSVLLSDDGECILGGLDCASFISDAPCKSVGEPLRRPPEMQQGSTAYGPSADIWALGLLAYELCTGKLPFTTEEQVARMDAPPPEERDQDLVTLVLRMLEKNPERRPTAQEVVRTLRRR
ncbi:Kinase, NEK [Giardia muris]|uniref:non-specific serine/threonine protein kinase n=1 Tax=Giardia muris TaxID=5742 RepID=A0A4Z1SNQ6_GIAMU|nr:Kinase, NEK [Giardia muris]|eukprot:TNJ27432.1 Kinase, NEK [Giardia muris]